MPAPSETPCPCGGGRTYASCCGAWHAGTPAPSAEALMRSRYSAYVFGLEDYLLATWHRSTRPVLTQRPERLRAEATRVPTCGRRCPLAAQ